MHITVHCPSCETRYQVDPSLGGKFMRCPNNNCRVVFQVSDNGQAPGGTKTDGPSPAPNGPDHAIPIDPQPPHCEDVGEALPILEAEPVDVLPSDSDMQRKKPIETPQPDENVIPLAPSNVFEEESPVYPVEAASWKQAPPVRKRNVTEPKPVPALPPPKPESAPPESKRKPQSKPNWQEKPPPVRRGDATPVPPTKESAAKSASSGVAGENGERASVGSAIEATTAPDPTVLYPDAAATLAKRRRARWLMAGMILCLAGIGAGSTLLVLHAIAHGEDERAKAASAEFDAGQFGKAATAFQKLAKDFPQSPQVAEYQFLDDYSRALQNAHDPGAPAHDATDELLAFLERHRENRLLESRVAPAKEALEQLASRLSSEARQALELNDDIIGAKATLARAKCALLAAKDFGNEVSPAATDEITKIETAIQRAENRIATFAILRRLPPTPEALAEGERLVLNAGLNNDPEAHNILTELRGKILAQVRFESAQARPELRTPIVGNRLFVASATVAIKSAPSLSEHGIEFAIARGVLYALASADGKPVWATRIGADAGELPVPIPARSAGPETVLVVSTEPPAITAREMLSGREIWRQRLPAPCVGPPILVNDRAFVPTLRGDIVTIDVPSGQLLGMFKTGARLAAGATRAEGSNLLYVPADATNVYVFDADQSRCVGIIQTGHAPGSLRGAPIVVRSETQELAPAGTHGQSKYLILQMVDGLGATRLRAFALEAGKGVQKPTAASEMVVPGWAWFAPECDGEKIVLATDSGTVAVFGINQFRNNDPALFRYVADAKPSNGGAKNRPRGRAQVVHAEENDFWVLSDANLVRWHLGIDRDRGMQLTQLWKRGIPLGWPSQAQQANAAGDTLLIVSRSLDYPGCMATAVNVSTGAVRWQRQLGAVPTDEPLLVDGRVVMQDRGGALFDFDPHQTAQATGEGWQCGGRILPNGLAHNSGGRVLLLPGGDGQSAVSIACDRAGTALEVRQYRGGEIAADQTITLNAPLAGTPAASSAALVVPLMDGTLEWHALGGNVPRYGPSWRGPTSPRSAQARAVFVAPDVLVTTDGADGLSRWRWAANGQARLENEAHFGKRIVSDPLMLPDEGICLAFEDSIVWLVNGRKLGERLADWKLNGPITSGPYRMSDSIACIVAGNRLVWWKQSEKQPHEYRAADTIVGRPRVIDGTIWIADEAGTITAVNSATGEVRDGVYHLPAGVAPAASPLPFGDEFLFVPLSDGTVELVPRMAYRANSQSSEKTSR